MTHQQVHSMVRRLQRERNKVEGQILRSLRGPAAWLPETRERRRIWRGERDSIDNDIQRLIDECVRNAAEGH